MITKSFLNYRRYLEAGTGATTPVTAGDIVATSGSNITTINGSSVNPRAFYYPLPSLSSSGNGFFLLVGDDDTPEAVTDYKIGNNITNTLSNYTWSLSATVGVDSGKNCYQKNAMITFVNNTGAAIDIKEIAGIFRISSTYDIMLYRKVIDPVHVEDGASATIAVTWFDF